MTYIEYLNWFNRWLESNVLPGNAQLMFFKFLDVFNRAGWPEYVQVDNLRLTLMIDAGAVTTAIRARDKLVESGFLVYIKGKKGAPNKYGLKNSINFATISATESATISATESATISATHIKTKTKTKAPPKSPHGDDAFAEFWSAYPRKDSKAKAKASWDKLKPDKKLFSRIMAALEQHKRSDQWSRDGGQYIPYPATWLNQRRWEDEGITKTPPEPPKNPNGPAYRKETDPGTGEEVIVWLK